MVAAKERFLKRVACIKELELGMVPRWCLKEFYPNSNGNVKKDRSMHRTDRSMHVV